MTNSRPPSLDGARARFERDGFLALRGYFTAEEVDAVAAAGQRALRERPMDFVVDSLETGRRTLYGLVDRPDSRLFKFNDFYLTLPEIRGLALEAGLSELLRELLGEHAPVLCNSLNFEKGSGQPMHIDSLFMTPQTPRHLAATWTAFEDVAPAAGPLEYYPGSHRIELYRFADGTRHASAAELPAWHAYIEGEIARLGLQKETFLARKGDVFIWHSDLVHGGAPIQDPASTRLSLVCHYYTESDCRRMPDWELRPLHAGFWLDRLPQPIPGVEPDAFSAERPFPEAAYLRRHADVRSAVEAGGISSGFVHYRAHGFAEGRGI